MSAAGFLQLLLPEERRRLGIVVALIVVTALLEATTMLAVYPFLVIAARPEVLPTHTLLLALYARSGADSTRGFLILLGAAILGMVVLTNLVGAFTTWTQQRFVRSFQHGLAVRLLRHYLLQPYSYFLSRNSAELQRSLLRDVSQISDGALDPGLEILSRGVAAASIFAVVLYVQPAVAIAAVILFGAVYLAFYRFSRRKLQEAGEAFRAAAQDAAVASAEALSVIKPLKVARREEHFVARYAAADAVSTASYARSTMYARLPRYMLEGAMFAFLMVAFLVVLASGGDLLTVLPVLGTFAFAGFRLMPAVHGIVASAGRLRFSRAAVESITQELASTPPPAEPSVRGRMRLLGEIRFNGVSFRYEGSERDVLQGIDITIPRGRSVGIVGRTGSGKTTTMDLLLGLLRPTKGEVLVDGQALTPENVARWQDNVAYVPQQIVLLDDTIARNIAFGLPDEEIDMGRVEMAARSANIHDFIANDLPEGYRTRVGERGVRLSGGQRQRLGIARALYEDREVIVFDEATSEVDSVTERAINEAIDSMAHRKTVVVVAHRFSAIRNCDQIVLLDAGRVIAAGSYDELMDSAAPFRKMAEA